MPTIKVNDLADLPKVAATLLNNYSNYKIWLFNGEMGAGKTTLIKAICKNLGVTDEVNSPTFTLVNEYAYTKGKIYHFDFHRIEHEEEAEDMGLYDYIDEQEFCFMEWPSNIQGLLQDESYLKLNIKINGKIREIEVEGH